MLQVQVCELVQHAEHQEALAGEGRAVVYGELLKASELL
jgi:hypothetical protein